MIKRVAQILACWLITVPAFAASTFLLPDLPNKSNSSVTSLLETDVSSEGKLLERETGIKQFRPRIRIRLQFGENHTFRFKIKPHRDHYEIRYTWTFY